MKTNKEPNSLSREIESPDRSQKTQSQLKILELGKKKKVEKEKE